MSTNNCTLFEEFIAGYDLPDICETLEEVQQVIVYYATHPIEGVPSPEAFNYYHFIRQLKEMFNALETPAA